MSFSSVNKRIKSKKVSKPPHGGLGADEDYYPFGMVQPGRQYAILGDSAYMFGFNGKLHDDDIYGSKNCYDYGMRFYDPRLGRFLSIDPEFRKYPFFSPYIFASNNPIFLIDYQGEGPKIPTNIKEIRKTLDDGKKVSSYQFTLYVEQPHPGTNDHISYISDVGHTFIKITKTNKDGSQITAAFGYYPDNHNDILKGGVPGKVNSKSTFGDDSKTEWHESVTKTIDAGQVNQILSTWEKFEKMQYNLDNNNCTDFGLAAAKIAGISIGNSSGSWGVGQGNNPADMGQAILRGDVSNTQTGNKNGITIETSPAQGAMQKEASTGKNEAKTLQNEINSQPKN